MLTPGQINTFNLFKLPSAYLCGVRARHIDDHSCEVSVRHRWINKNPFRSMFWAVQGMAAELTTGALLMSKIRQSGHNISMLVLHNKAQFLKKATGRIMFRCDEGSAVDKVIEQAISTREGQTIWLKAEGVNSDGIVVSKFEFEWTIKVKSV